MRSLLQYSSWAMDLRPLDPVFPASEYQVYDYIVHLRAAHLPMSRGSKLVEALALLSVLFDLEQIPWKPSSRIKGALRIGEKGTKSGGNPSRFIRLKC
eukprot:6069063-Amphidinium_carterae.1